MKTYEQTVRAVFAGRDAILQKKQRRKKAVKRALVPVACSLAAALAVFAAWRGGVLRAVPPAPPEGQTAREPFPPEEPTASAPVGMTEIGTEPSGPESPSLHRPPEGTSGPSAQPAQTDPPAQPPAVSQPHAPENSGPTVQPTENPTEPPSGEDVPGGPGTANAVYTRVRVDYAAAKEKFGRPIKACAAPGFTGYQVGVVSRSGNAAESGAFCIAVIYTFKNGEISLSDQSAAHATPEGERREYRGRTFYVDTRNDYPGVYEDRVRIGYFPDGEGAGIAYFADFGAETDPYGLMDLILSLEI